MKSLIGNDKATVVSMRRSGRGIEEAHSIRESFELSGRTCGSPRVWHDLELSIDS